VSTSPHDDFAGEVRTSASAELGRRGPTAVIFPFCTTSTLFSIVAPLIVMIVAPLNASGFS
jgi:hypothetical protein